MQRVRTPGPTVAGGGGARTVNFVTARGDGGSGTVMVMGMVPFIPGEMTSANLTKVIVRDNGGNEKTIAIQAAASRFHDNATYASRSLRCAHVQFTHSVSDGTPLTFTVEIGGATRGGSDNSWVEPIYSSGTATIPALNHLAFMVPDESQYWCDTFAALTPLLPYASESAGAAKTWYRTDTGTTRSARGWWQSNLTTNGFSEGIGLSAYPHVWGMYCAAVRSSTTADRVWWYTQFLKTLVNQLVEDDTNYFGIGSAATGNQYAKVWQWDASLPTVADTSQYGYGLEHRMGYSIDWAIGYLATGWSQPRRKLCQMLSWSWGGGLNTYALMKVQAVGDGVETRFNFHIKNFQHVMPYLVEATTQIVTGAGGGRDNATESFIDTVPWILDALEEYERTTPANLVGVPGCRDNAANTLNYQYMLVANFLLLYWFNIKQDTRISTWIPLIADYMITQLVYDAGTSEVSLRYLNGTATYTTTEADTDVNSWSYGPYLSEIFGAAYAFTANSTYSTWYDRCVTDAATRRASLGHTETPTTKNQGEYFAGNKMSGQYYRNGGSMTPTCGSSSSSVIVNVPTASY